MGFKSISDSNCELFSVHVHFLLEGENAGSLTMGVMLYAGCEGNLCFDGKTCLLQLNIYAAFIRDFLLVRTSLH